MKRMLLKSEMEPTLLSNSSTGMRNKYHVIFSVVPLRSEGMVSRLSTMKFRPTARSPGRTEI